MFIIRTLAYKRYGMEEVVPNLEHLLKKMKNKNLILTLTPFAIGFAAILVGMRREDLKLMILGSLLWNCWLFVEIMINKGKIKDLQNSEVEQ